MRSAHKAHQDMLQAALVERVLQDWQRMKPQPEQMARLVQASADWDLLTQTRRNYIIGLIHGLAFEQEHTR